MAIRNYTDLIAWQKAMELTEAIYKATGIFPKDEIYTLSAQMRRAAISVPCNIAEGQGRGSDREFAHFLSIAHGSLRELETQVLLAGRLKYVDDSNRTLLLATCAEVGRLITGLSNSLRTSS